MLTCPLQYTGNLSAVKMTIFQGSKCPSLPGLTHWVNLGLPGLGFKPYFGKVGNTGEQNILNVQNCAKGLFHGVGN